MLDAVEPACEADVMPSINSSSIIQMQRFLVVCLVVGLGPVLVEAAVWFYVSL
jgi:hypothetical protein